MEKMTKMTDDSALISLYSALYDQEQEAEEIRKMVSDQLKGAETSLHLSAKALKAGYRLFKKYKNGKDTQQELDDYSEVENAVLTYFADSQEY